LHFFILIKITQCHYLDRTFLQNRTTDFDETLHVAWVCLCEGFGNSGRSGDLVIAPFRKRRPEAAFALRVIQNSDVSQMGKMTVFGLLNLPKLISRKI